MTFWATFLTDYYRFSIKSFYITRQCSVLSTFTQYSDLAIGSTIHDFRFETFKDIPL